MAVVVVYNFSRGAVVGVISAINRTYVQYSFCGTAGTCICLESRYPPHKNEYANGQSQEGSHGGLNVVRVLSLYVQVIQ